MKARLLFLGLVVFWAANAFAQAGAGYTKIASTNGLSQIDTSVVDGDVYQYQVTSVNQFGESTPITSNVALIPATGTHSVTVSWGASATAGVTYNVYRITGAIPSPPALPTSGPVATVN
jgi:fibronectin type 3 domain-containing protein